MQALRHALTPARALLLAVLLLLAQAAGLAHRVAHGGPADAAALSTQSSSASAHGHDHGHVHGHAHAHGHGVSDHQQAGAECRLLDQLLGHADGLASAQVGPTKLPAQRALAGVVQASAWLVSAAAYQARAPPAA